MCLGVNVIALVLNVNFRKLGFHWMEVVGVFIASNQFLAVGWVCCRWAHWTVRWCTELGNVHYPVRATWARHWGLERLTIGTLCPFAAPDMSGVFWLRSLTSDFCTVRFSLFMHQTCPDRLGAQPGASDTVRCATCSTLSSLCSKFIWVPNLISFLVYIEPYAPKIKYI
jgi:hypothetical protein